MRGDGAGRAGRLESVRQADARQAQIGARNGGVDRAAARGYRTATAALHAHTAPRHQGGQHLHHLTLCKAGVRHRGLERVQTGQRARADPDRHALLR